MPGSSYLVDTNILLRLVEPDRPEYGRIRQCRVPHVSLLRAARPRNPRSAKIVPQKSASVHGTSMDMSVYSRLQAESLFDISHVELSAHRPRRSPKAQDRNPIKAE